MRKALLLGCCVFLLLSLVLGSLAWWAPLPRAAGATLLRSESSEPAEGRVVHHVLLEDASLGSISLSLSLPSPLPERPLPVVFVLGGLQTGQASIAHVREPGDNILVGYDWPIPRKLPSGAELVGKIPDLRRRALSVPGQIAAAMGWVAAQPWADGERISLLGLTERTCKWPIGDPLSSSFHFCGRTSEDSRPYCDFHSRKAYHQIEKKRR